MAVFYGVRPNDIEQNNINLLNQELHTKSNIEPIINSK